MLEFATGNWALAFRQTGQRKIFIHADSHASFDHLLRVQGLPAAETVFSRFVAPLQLTVSKGSGCPEIYHLRQPLPTHDRSDETASGELWASSHPIYRLRKSEDRAESRSRHVGASTMDRGAPAEVPRRPDRIEILLPCLSHRP